jgi:sugar phosphate isomerase/epimerase
VNQHRALGRGTIDWDGVFTALKKYEFEGYVDVGRVENLEEEIKESVKFLRDIARKFKI